MEKRFRETKGKRSSGSARRRRMSRRGVEINLTGDKWELGGGGAMSRGCAGWGAERAHGTLRAFPLVALPACPRKVRNGNCEIVSGDARESRVEEG